MLFSKLSVLNWLQFAAILVVTVLTTHYAPIAWEELRAWRQGLPHELREMDRLALPRIEGLLEETVPYRKPNGDTIFIVIGSTDTVTAHDCNGLEVPLTRREIAAMLRELRLLRNDYARDLQREQFCPQQRVPQLTAQRS